MCIGRLLVLFVGVCSVVRSLSLSQNCWQIQRIDLVYQHSIICISVCQNLSLFTAFGVSVFFILQGVSRKNIFRKGYLKKTPAISYCHKQKE